MLTAALLTALSFAPSTEAHQGWLLAQNQVPPPSQSVADREATLKALRDEKAELEDQKSSIGYVFPVIFIAVGVGLGVFGEFVEANNHTSIVGPICLGTGAVIATLSVVWLIYRIVRSVSLSHQISEKENQIEELQRQRFQPVVVPTPRGGVIAGFAYQF